jgi:hypothetical protein
MAAPRLSGVHIRHSCLAQPVGDRGHDQAARSACDSERPTTVTHGHSTMAGTEVQAAFALVRALETHPRPVVRGGVEPPTFRFSGVADAQVRSNMRELLAVDGCLRLLATAVVAVMVAVGDTSGPSAVKGGVESGLPTPPAAVPVACPENRRFFRPLQLTAAWSA